MNNGVQSRAYGDEGAGAKEHPEQPLVVAPDAHVLRQGIALRQQQEEPDRHRHEKPVHQLDEDVELHDVYASKQHGSARENDCQKAGVERRSLGGRSIQREVVVHSERLADCPGGRQGHDERCAQGSASEAQRDKDLGARGPEQRRDRVHDIGDGVYVGVLLVRVGQGDQHADHDELRQHAAQHRLFPLQLQVFNSEPAGNHRALLKVDHPRHNDSPDVGGDEREVLGVAGNREALLQDLGNRRVAVEHGHDKHELE
mmetsp:Transcript_104103/g.282853  ORF Transcript_104103/g.282853 Transcript_104103/m.282853 type:complete len:257 (-) Transcript_104103:467-1237(-)